MNWIVYLIESCNQKRTYIGITNNCSKRLKCHNGELKGGAKATRTGKPWKYICTVSGFDKKTAAQFEWYAKRKKTKNNTYRCISGKYNRINNIFNLLEEYKKNGLDLYLSLH